MKNSICCKSRPVEESQTVSGQKTQSGLKLFGNEDLNMLRSRAVASLEEAWESCVRWLAACWQEKVLLVLEELRDWQALHPSPPGPPGT